MSSYSNAFQPACDDLLECYENHFNKDTCDDQFETDLNDICDSDFSFFGSISCPREVEEWVEIIKNNEATQDFYNTFNLV